MIIENPYHRRKVRKMLQDLEKFTMKLADPVNHTTTMKREVGHVEVLIIILRLCSTQSQELFIVYP